MSGGAATGSPAFTPSAGATPARALEGRAVLVAGAHGALGHAAALACADAGATVVLLGRKVPKLNRVHDAIARGRAGAAVSAGPGRRHARRLRRDGRSHR